MTDDLDRLLSAVGDDWRKTQGPSPSLARALDQVLAGNKRQRLRGALVGVAAAALVILGAGVALVLTHGDRSSSSVASCAPPVISLDRSDAGRIRHHPEPSRLEPGDHVEIYGWHFLRSCQDTVTSPDASPGSEGAPELRVRLVLRSEGSELAAISATPDSSGAFTAQLVVPQATAAGAARIEAVGASTKIRVVISAH